MSDERNVSVSVVKEQLVVDKGIETTGSVHVRKTVEEVRTPVKEILSRETYEVERIEKNEAVAEAPEAVRTEGDSIVISVVEERLVVEKRLFLIEEIHLRKKTKTEVHHDEIVLKKEVVDVVRKPASE